LLIIELKKLLIAKLYLKIKQTHHKRTRYFNWIPYYFAPRGWQPASLLAGIIQEIQRRSWEISSSIWFWFQNH